MAVVPAPGFTENEVLRLAAGLERPSQHPLAEAVVRAAEARGIVLPPVEGFDSPMGRGVTGMVEAVTAVLPQGGVLAVTVRGRKVVVDGDRRPDASFKIGTRAVALFRIPA